MSDFGMLGHLFLFVVSYALKNIINFQNLHLDADF